MTSKSEESYDCSIPNKRLQSRTVQLGLNTTDSVMSTEEHSLFNTQHDQAALNSKITRNGIYWIQFL